MKYVITGSAGNISRPLAEKLLESGHEVTVIGRNAEHLKVLTDQGAKAAIGSVEDRKFLSEAFRDADAVYTMVPPIYIDNDWKGYIAGIGENYAAALKDSRALYVVNLSSFGAHRPDGCGPVSGLHRAEHALDSLAGKNVLHLRPGYFYSNFLSSIGMVKNMNFIGSNFGGEGFKLVMSYTGDIAEEAAKKLNSLSFSGKSSVYIASDVRSTEDIARAFGSAIGKPDLPWVTFTDEQMNDGLLAAGLPGEIAKNYTEMGKALRTGIMAEDFFKHRPARLGKTSLEDFAKIFAESYNAG
ncbi:NAD(P)H-binding protein [Flavihumibacter solisilvae]|uniref:NAD(P)-binding domain-containing protein n=1 Tax=Flavihumibacter solisilvae TaxID=1349421 RepID=A0A0C1IQY1_9BACT|nr:NAD(P)H-binding protein [Flavihumibacter solisilvae]KIC92879.1 hypothetical protein OI18_20925 [Flavihumibacter solisilvae]